MKCPKLLLVTLFLLSSIRGLPAQSVDNAIVNSAVFLRFKPDAIHETRGSGFLLLRQISGDAAAKRYSYQVLLITNKHMLPPEHGSCKQVNVRVTVRTGTEIQIKDVPIDIIDKQGRYLPSVALHPDPLVDVAAINISEDLQNANAGFLEDVLKTHQALTTDLLINRSDMKEAAIGIGTQIYMLGFPGGVYDARNAQPILRIGVIATEPENDYSFDPAMSAQAHLPSPIPGFLIDANVFPGSSGSMVIRRTNIVPGVSMGGKRSIPYILGIVADSIPINDIWGTSRMGLGVVFGADTIRQTIELLSKM